VRLTTPNTPLDWTKSVNVMLGSVVLIAIDYKDISGVEAHDMTVRAYLSPQLQIVPRSVLWYDANNDGTQLPNTALGSGGVDLGNYLSVPADSDPNGEVMFRVVVENNFSPSQCGSFPPLDVSGLLRTREHPHELRSDATIVVSDPCA
jgi:hypothetical protein